VSRPSDAFNAEFDYLWHAVGEAQDASLRSDKERAEARKNLGLAASKAAFLEKQLAEALGREKHLKAEADRLRAAAKTGEAALAKAAAQARENSELREQAARQESELVLAGPELEGLRAETAGLREALAARDAAIESFKEKVSGIMALPEIARVVKEDSAASGKDISAYAELLERLENARRKSEDAAAELTAAAAAENSARQALAGSEKQLSDARAVLAAKEQELAELNTALAAAAEKGRFSVGEKAALEGRLTALQSAMAEKAAALENALAESAGLRTQLDRSRMEMERLRQAAADGALRAEEQRNNFAGAVGQVFELQKRAAALKAALSSAQEQNGALAAELKASADNLEKVNGLLRDSKTSLTQEKEISRRAAQKIKTLETEIDAIKTRLTAAADYSSRVLKAVEERDLALGAGKAARLQDQHKLAELEAENEDLRRRNIRFSEMLKREQADFTARMLTGLEKSAKDLKSFNLRIPAAERKSLEPSLKNLLSTVNLLKGWQEYLDPETPDFEDTDLASFVMGETGKWERAFKLRKLGISAAILNPRLRARLAPERVKMLFHNLIKNAYERLQQGGSLRVTLKGSEDGRLAVMIFEDTGPGFAREALDKLFAPFNTTDKGKAGIGLAVARRIAEKHGGTLEVSNKKERGAIVEVRLPLGTTAP
jgi:signal transduction histidine kinase